MDQLTTFENRQQSLHTMTYSTVWKPQPLQNSQNELIIMNEGSKWHPFWN